MNIKQIETFARIVELGSFQAAAAALCASPSTVSTRIKDLEHYIGAELFDRSFHRAQLTARGHEFYETARQLVQFTASLARRIESPQDMTGLVRLGIVGMLTESWMPSFVRGLHATYPKMNFRIDANSTRPLLERLCEGRLDFAIFLGDTADPSLHCETLGSDRYVWMSAPQGACAPADGAVSTPADLALQPLITMTDDPLYQHLLKHWFRDAGVVPTRVTSSNRTHVLAALAKQGVGVALLPRSAFRREAESGSLVELSTEPAFPEIALKIACHKERPHPLTEKVISLAREASEQWTAAAQASLQERHPRESH